MNGGKAMNELTAAREKAEQGKRLSLQDALLL